MTMVACTESLGLLSLEFGKSHPRILETTGHMVEIFNLQCQFTKGLTTAKSLYTSAETSLAEPHPLRVQLEFRLAISHLLEGDYRLAGKYLEHVVDAWKDRYHGYHPDTLYYQSELARAYHKLGRIADARTLAFNVLSRQAMIYSIPSFPPLEGKECGEDTLEIILRVADEYVEKNPDKTRIHPRILFTMEVIAWVELQNSQSDEGLVHRILWVVLSQKLRTLGHQHMSTLSSAYDFAELYAASDKKDSIYSAKFWFTYVYCQRATILGFGHPETISARRELTSMNCVLNIWQNLDDDSFVSKALSTIKKSLSIIIARPMSMNDLQNIKIAETISMEGDDLGARWSDVEYASRKILNLHEIHLGQYHPETLKTLFWLFTIHLNLDLKPQSEAILELIFNRLQYSPLRTQRLVEALDMEEKIAMLYREKNCMEEALGVLRDVQEEVSRISCDDELREVLQETNVAVSKTLAEWESISN
ncbi:hypothetical protein F5X99DRAFT_432516 [Biscogniauxia marginata]|nr:hypothetical protein F5X99DRAFT_432516 [Biscogniauxia marginata]